MKNIFLFLCILLSMKSFSQGADTIITSLQLKAKTIKVLLGISTLDQNSISTVVKWAAQIRPNNPADNANVTIDTAYTLQVSIYYRALMNLPGGILLSNNVLDDFRTSITGKRNTNVYLDQLMTGIESEFNIKYTDFYTHGDLISKKRY